VIDERKIKEKSMALSKDQEEIYKKAMEAAKKELDGVDEKMQAEIQKARQRLAELQESKKQHRQIYEGTALLLGIEVEPEADDKELGESEEKDEAKPDSKAEKGETKGDDKSDSSQATQAQTA
jgi:hypothetical protein